MLVNTFTKTVGSNPNLYSIFQMALDRGTTAWYNGATEQRWDDKLHIMLSMIQVDTTQGIENRMIKQYITYEDLKELSMLLWQAQQAYESREKEFKEEAERGREAANETKA
jgi:hypothetical protein